MTKKKPVAPIGGNTRYRFEQWVQNPDCQANMKSAVFDVRMSDVANLDLKRPSPGPSPFALIFGVTFENGLFHKDAERLCEELTRSRMVAKGERLEFVDLRTRQSHGPLTDISIARVKTEKFFRDLPTTIKSP